MKTMLNELLAVGAMSAALLLLNLPSPARAAEVRPYLLQVCLVTGNELGSMGKVVTKVHDRQEVKLCCKPCVKKFNANPAKYLSKLGK